MFNKEKFHNELAMRLGYERIVHDKRISISVEESDDPCVILKFHESKDIRINVSGKDEEAEFDVIPEMRAEVIEIVDAVHQAYLMANKTLF